MNDVRDILDMGGDMDMGPVDESRKVGRKRGVVRPKENPPKRPEGMHRELYALLCADGGKNFQELAPILPTDAPGGYKKKIKLGAKKVRKWKWEPFAHPGRKDGPFLCHWKRLGDENKEYPFAKFNSEVGIPQYSDTEYSNHLEQEGWSKAETDHLFDLCRRFDLRFFVIQDRWDYKSFGHKSVEEIKDRYYNICNILTKLRQEQGTPDPKVINYDADHEKRRKEQLRKLWGRTPEQVEEEDFLRAELKKIEARKKEREKKTQDLQKLITAADAGNAQAGDGQTPATPSAGGPNLGKKLTSSDQKKSALLAAKKKSGKTPLATRAREGSLSLNAPDVFLGIKWPDFKTAGVFVRSQKMKLPSSVGTKKVKAIEQILHLLGIDIIHTPTEEITTQFNELRSDIVLLYELKSALTTCEMEIHSLAHQYEATTGKKLDIPPIFLNESTSNLLRALETPLKIQGAGGIQPPSTPLAPGSISSSLGVNDLDIVVPHRKRKAALDQANILRKLKAKM